jgi:hypothetical protein
VTTQELEVFAGALHAFEERLRPALMREILSTALRAESAAIGFYDERLRRRTGRLARTISGEVDETPDGFGFRLRGGGLSKGGGEVRYGRAQERGATIRPKRGRFLAIPVGPALKPSGEARYASPREVPGLRFQPIHNGNAGLLVRDIAGRGKKGTGARSEVWFRLVPRVTIRPKYFLRDGFAASQEGFADRLRAAAEGALRAE